MLPITAITRGIHWTGQFKTQPGKADEVVEVLKENLAHIESSELETISFLVLKRTDEEDVKIYFGICIEMCIISLRDIPG